MVNLRKWLDEAKSKRRTMPDILKVDYVNSFDGARLRYAYAARKIESSDRECGTVLFLPGRTEFIEKFYEDMHIFQQFGYAVAGMDLRGQGLSYREDPDRDKHYLSSFDPHTMDIKTVIEALKAQGMPEPYTIVAHSAGSHVTLRFLHDYGDMVKTAVTVSPMIRIAGPGFPDWLMKGLPNMMVRLGLGHWYVPGHKAFKTGRWGWRKLLTHDDERFKDEDHFIFNQDRDLAVGGATHRWISEAIKSTDILNSEGYPEAIDTPVLMLLAVEDKIIDTEAMSKFAERLPECRLYRVEGAKHEILKETDAVRWQIWQQIVSFLELSP